MASTARAYDCFVFGGGLAGCVLAQTLIQNGKRPLVIDEPGKSRCSRVAAGLVNPIGGRRLNLAWMADTLIPFATHFYKQFERSHGAQFFHPRPIARLFANDQERSIWRKKSLDPAYARWIAPLSSIALPEFVNAENDDGFAINGSGYLDMPLLLDTIQADLKQSNALIETEFDYAEIDVQEKHVAWRDRSASFAIFCEGHLATSNPWFSFAPYKPAKGVIGKITTDIQFPDTAFIKKHFLIPRHDQSISVGATYNWDQQDDSPDKEGITELETFLTKTLGDSWQWVSTDAGVRPATAGAKPIIGPHPRDSRILSFNGFGSKGSTQTPFFAQALHDFLWKDAELPAGVLPSRFLKKQVAEPKRWIAVEIARDRTLERIKTGDTVIDATAGNGHDTLWLAQKVGPTGTAYAFDIQKKAIEKTRTRLEKANCSEQAILIHDSHANLAGQIPSTVQANAIVFNLGYLPGGDRTVVTQTESTIAALDQSLAILKPGGILSVVLYPGHHGGNDETAAVLKWSRQLDPEIFDVETVNHPAGIEESPFPLFVVKR